MRREDLIGFLAAGGQAKYLFFWGHTPPADESVSKSCLSQWWHAPFTVDAVTYATAEHWMMAAKADLFGDLATREAIIAARTPKEAKALGRKVANYDDARWEATRFGAVVEGNFHKFSQHADLGEWLVKTGDRVLVEASPVDPVWGIGLDEHHADAANPAKWPGLNLLGFALMEVRERLARG